MRVLVVVASPPERDAVLRLLPGVTPVRVGPYAGHTTAGLTVVASGIGPAGAAAVTAAALAHGAYDAVVNLGICGGFAGAASIGDVVVATDIVAADLGVESPDGWLGLAILGWAEEALPVQPHLVQWAADLLGAADLPVVTGPLLTLSSMTGTDARAAVLAERHGAVAEAMEGRGAAEAAAPYALPFLEIRTVSNAVGRRDKSAWRIPQALDVLAVVAATLLAEGQSWPFP